MSVSVRVAGPNDVDAIVAFAADLVPRRYAPILGVDAAQAQFAWWTTDPIESAVAAGRVHVVVAGDAVVGVSQTGEYAGDQVI